SRKAHLFLRRPQLPFNRCARKCGREDNGLATACQSLRRSLTVAVLIGIGISDLNHQLSIRDGESGVRLLIHGPISNGITEAKIWSSGHLSLVWSTFDCPNCAQFEGRG